jgi:hypothetical protein
VKITQVDGQCLLCLNQAEILMMASVFQASLLHAPTRQALLSRRDYGAFHRQIMAGLAGRTHPQVLDPQVLDPQVLADRGSAA